MNLYFDTAYVAKCYLNEPGAAKIRQLARRASSLNSSALCIAEFACVIHRNLRERSVSPAQASRVRDQLAEDIQNEVWRLIPMTNRLLQRVDSLVRGLPTDCFLRSGDAIHLTSAIDAGFQESGVLVTEIDYSTLKYSPQRRYEVQREILERIRLLPGVEQAAAAGIIPISGNLWRDRFQFVGGNSSNKFISNFSAVTSGYFRTLGTPLLAGRDFNERDTMNSPRVAIVNESFIKQFPSANVSASILVPASPRPFTKWSALRRTRNTGT